MPSWARNVASVGAAHQPIEQRYGAVRQVQRGQPVGKQHRRLGARLAGLHEVGIVIGDHHQIEGANRWLVLQHGGEHVMQLGMQRIRRLGK